MPGGKCDVCGSTDFKVIDVKGRVQVRECKECGLVYTHPRHDENALGEVYSKEYYREEYNRKYGKAYKDDIPAIERMARQRMTDLERLCGRKGRILDIGCALGVYLNVAKNDGWDVSGIEISPFCSDFIREEFGIRTVFQGTVETAGYLEEEFDAVTMWLVIEHLADPVTVLRKIHKWLKPDGVIGLKVPHFQGITGLFNRPLWLRNRPVDHSVDYSVPTLSRLLEKTGYHICEHYTEGIYFDRFIRAVKDARQQGSSEAVDVSSEEFAEAYNGIARKLDLGDTLVMYARKFQKQGQK